MLCYVYYMPYTCKRVIDRAGYVVVARQTTSSEFGRQYESNEPTTESVHERRSRPAAGDLHRLAVPEPAHVPGRRRRRSRQRGPRHADHGGPAYDRPAAARSTRRTDAFPLEHFEPT